MTQNGKVEFYKDAKGEWRWRFKHRNGKLIAEGGEGYKRPGAAEKAFDRFTAIILQPLTYQKHWLTLPGRK